MASAGLKELLDRIPIKAVFIAYVAFVGYGYYEFKSDPSSPLKQKEALYKSLKTDNAQLQAKASQAQEFIKTLDMKRNELRTLTQQLADLKSSIKSQVDVPSVVKLLVSEAGRVGLRVSGIKPLAQVTKEYYVEQPFDFVFRAVYVQLLVFLQRISELTELFGVDRIELKPVGTSAGRFVELEGSIQIKGYRYLGTPADEIGKKGAGK
ncbi:type 4a pilus biogenesis protein PilO [Bdellovibrionota bacterium FG-2]